MDGHPPSARIVEEVSDHTGATPTDLPPLFDVVDPDALDAIVRGPSEDGTRSDVTVRFRYDGYLVTVDGSNGAGQPKVTVEADAVIE